MPKDASEKTRRRAKVVRKKKDLDAPKRALSAYMFFANTNRDVIKAEKPDVTFGQIGKLLGQRWKSLSPAEKLPYETKAQADKNRYEKEKAHYIANKQY